VSSDSGSSQFHPSSYPVLYRGSVKDLRGPVMMTGSAVSQGAVSGVVFDYSEAYSVFDWGRMPDLLPKKGAALALIAASWFESLERAETWKDFSRSPDATALRKGNRFGSVFNELGEELQRSGLRTHYLGVLNDQSNIKPTTLSEVPLRDAHPLSPLPLSAIQQPVRHLAVRAVSVVKPAITSVLGRQIPDYLATRTAPAPRLVPLEVVFRFSCPPGSSLLERTARDPHYLTSIGFGDWKLTEGGKWEFPILEVFTKLETIDRPLTLTEAVAISGLSATQMERLLLSTAWVAGWLRSVCRKAGVELADGKLEWAMDADGALFLVDAIGPDELRLLKDGVQLSKEFLRIHYRETSWYAALDRAKELGRTRGVVEWKKFVAEPPPALPVLHRDLASQLYMSLANELTGRRWFESAWPLSRVVDGIRGALSPGMQK
jgi:phosphoribosylaminoimidazole-succinocarboxamide synthase